MPEDINEILKRVRGKYLEEESFNPAKYKFLKIKDRIVTFFLYYKKEVLISMACLICLSIGIYISALDFITKHQNYPERNVLFRARSVVDVSGGNKEKKTKNPDMLSDTFVYEVGIESKVGTYLFRTVRELREDIEYFNMDDTQKIRIASASQKSEIVQTGLQIGGSLNFREQFAEIIPDSESKAARSYQAYNFIPKRCLNESEITVLTNEDGKKSMINCLTELREWGIGWMWGKEFRAGTFLEQYLKTPENEEIMGIFHEKIKMLDSPGTVNKSQREEIIEAAGWLSEEIQTQPVYLSYEDGFFDLLPQESTIYLAYKPDIIERYQDAILGKSRHIRLRVENHWDLFPGRYPILRRFHIGKGDNVVYPFDKYNNGGYVIKDKFGDLARIDIQDFILYYGHDVLYLYYIDISGDGKIDKKKELIGTVLCRTGHDERITLESMREQGESKGDVKVTIHYSFMAPDADLQKGLKYFNLCGYIESMMPDQVNRGFEKHSMLGYINQQRSDIILFKDMSIENMSRALTEESTLTAAYDIVHALTAAKRPYAKEVAAAYGIADQFRNYDFQAFEQLLVEKRDWGMIIGLISVLVLFTVYKICRIFKNSKSELCKDGLEQDFQDRPDLNR